MSLKHAYCCSCGVYSPGIADGEDIEARLADWGWGVHPAAIAEAEEARLLGRPLPIKPNLICSHCRIVLAEGGQPRPVRKELITHLSL